MADPYTDAELEELRQGEWRTPFIPRLLATVDELKAKLDALRRDNERMHTGFRRAEFLEAERDRLREAIEDALGRHQATHIHAALRAALGKKS